MEREFVYTNTFSKSWESAGFDDRDLKRFESFLLQDPHAGDVIPELSGARKIRFAYEGRGKSGSVRVIYVDVMTRGRIYCLLAYPKNVQTNLTKEQKKVLRKLISALKEE